MTPNHDPVLPYTALKVSLAVAQRGNVAVGAMVGVITWGASHG